MRTFILVIVDRLKMSDAAYLPQLTTLLGQPAAVEVNYLPTVTEPATARATEAKSRLPASVRSAQLRRPTRRDSRVLSRQRDVEGNGLLAPTRLIPTASPNHFATVSCVALLGAALLRRRSWPSRGRRREHRISSVSRSWARTL